MATELTNEQKKQRTEMIAKVAIAGAVCFAVSPIIFTVIHGLVGLLIAGAIGFTAIQLTPYFAMKIANTRMKLLMNEASKNPIETMNNVYKDNMETIRAKDQKIAQFEARLGDFKSKMALFSKQYPGEVSQFEQVQDKMALVLSRQKTKQKAAKAAAKEFHDQIVKAEAIYEMALAAHSVTELAGSMEKQVFQDIKKRVAFDSVTHSFNVAVAELSVEADTDPEQFLNSSEMKQLPDSTGSVPQAQVIDAEYVPVERKVRS